VVRRVGLQPSGGLLELPLAADAVAPAGLVPGDRYVDEALEEVTFVGLGCSPSVLQLLVSGEELAPANQLEARRELLRLRL
jgi:hypothetical protein